MCLRAKVVDVDTGIALPYKVEFADGSTDWFDEETLTETDLEGAMPLQVGSTIWVIDRRNKKIKSGKVDRVIWENGIYSYYSPIYGFTGDDIGKTVFRTEAEAEFVLKQIGE